MKTKHISLFIMMIAPVFLLTSHAQENKKKQFLIALAQNIPTTLPLVKKDFKRVSSPFGNRIHPVLKETKFHSGIDLIAPKGAAVLATGTGIVTRASYKKGYGNCILISHLSGIKTLYAHLWLNLVKTGDKVSQGQIIGVVGDSGITTGPHLHYEVHYKNKTIDPLIIWRHLLKQHASKLPLGKFTRHSKGKTFSFRDKPRSI